MKTVFALFIYFHQVQIYQQDCFPRWHPKLIKILVKGKRP